MNKNLRNLMCFLVFSLLLFHCPFSAYADVPEEFEPDPLVTDLAIPDSDGETIDTGQDAGTSVPLQTELGAADNLVSAEMVIVQNDSFDTPSFQSGDRTEPVAEEMTANGNASLPPGNENQVPTTDQKGSEEGAVLTTEPAETPPENDPEAQPADKSPGDEKPAEKARGDPPEEASEPPDSMKSSEPEEKAEDEENEETDGQGNLTAEREGIILEGGGSFDILVEGTLKSGEVPILVKQDVIPENVKITVWEIENPVESNGEEHVVFEESDGGKPAATDKAKEIEQNILYIIKKAISEAKITLSRKEGGALETSHGYEVANKKDIVVMKVEVPDGYRLKDAWCDDEKQIRIIPGDDGSYSVEVPRGGGVYLSVELDKEDDDDDDDDDGYVVCIPAGCAPCSCTCTEGSFEIVFDLNGGELNGDKGPIRFLKECGDTMQLLEAPVRPGYRFVRWAACPKCECVKVDQPGEEFVVKCDVTFTAVWEAIGSYGFNDDDDDEDDDDDDEDEDDEDVTETVVIQPKDGESIEREINGSVVIDDDPATGIRVEGSGSGKSTVELEVDGKISVTGKEQGAVGVSVTAGENNRLKADVEAENGMTVKSGGESTGIQVEAKGGAELEVEFEGNVDVTSGPGNSVGVDVSADSSGSATVEVEGNLKSDGTGAVLHADGGHVELRIGEDQESS